MRAMVWHWGCRILCSGFAEAFNLDLCSGSTRSPPSLAREDLHKASMISKWLRRVVENSSYSLRMPLSDDVLIEQREGVEIDWQTYHIDERRDLYLL